MPKRLKNVSPETHQIVTGREAQQFAVEEAIRQLEAQFRAPKPVAATASQISSYMAKLGRKGGKIGGKRRLVTLSKARRSAIAKAAATARWANKPSKAKAG